MGEAILYGIPGSHAVRTGELMLQHKDIPYRRKNFPPGLHRLIVRLLGFPGDRVPAVRFADGRRAQCTRPLARELDEIQPEPCLVPADPRVEEAERWGDDVLQQWARRMVAGGGNRDPELLDGRGARGRLGPLLAPTDRRRRMVVKGVVRAFGVTEAQMREDDRQTAELLDRVDAFIAEGVLNGPSLNCADFQIATSLALVDYRLDVRPQMEDRPLYELLERVLPGQPG
jgi:glutathione S-transferase